MYRRGTSRETESRLVAARGWGWGMTANGYGSSFRDDENILQLHSSDGLHNSVNTLRAIDLYALNG